MSADKSWKDFLAKWLFQLPLIAVLVVILAPAVLLWLLGLFLLKIFALLLVWMTWFPRGISMLTIYSNSPHWQQYFEEGLLPLVEKRSKVLNWSERSQWPMSTDRFAFSVFKGEQEFNPMIIFFRPFRWPKFFRFHQPFKDARHGKTNPLRNLENDLSDWINQPIHLQQFHPRPSA